MRPFLVALLLLACPALAAAQGQEVHGADSVFGGDGVAIAWGVLKGAIEEETQVIIRIVPTRATYAYVSVEAVDPFSGGRRLALSARPLEEPEDVRSPRWTFGDFPRREIHLYRTADDLRAGNPALTVYYLGVPDTTPEFTSETALFAYLASALAKVRGADGGRRP